MLNCKQTAELMTQAMDRPLGLGERIGLWVHLLVCGGCRNAWKQFEFIRDACVSWVRRDD